jgi:5-methyltetrahydrofolate--homocysteine methyltransferase
MHTTLEGTAKTVLIGSEVPFVVIGERINPSGKRNLAESLRRGDMSLVRQEALAQANAGAHIIDVNVTAEGVDEEAILPLAVQTVAEAVDIPICIDTADFRALAESLDRCPGTPLVNSVTGEADSLQTVLPLVKERGCAVIGLCVDEDGVPADAGKRLEISQRMIRAAEEIGISKASVIIDPLATTIGADGGAGITTLLAIRAIAEELGVNTTLGGSNISFGLPERSLINRSFLPMLIEAGLTSAIVDPLDVEIRRTIAAADLLLGRDEYAEKFLQRFRNGW